MSKFFKRVMAGIFAVCMLSVAACDKDAGNPSVSTPSGSKPAEEYEFTERVIKTDGQNFNGYGVTYPDELWQAPEYEYCTDLDFGGVGDVKGLFMTSPITYNGKKTKIAAYMGFPEGASATNKVPAIVLVHGGLGTAIPDWVKYWNDHGFAAISVDTEGAEPTQGVSNYNNVHMQENRYKNDAVYTNGPTNVGFGDSDKPMSERWYYHATSAVILANSLISSFDCVDTQKVGITGISWGGMLTCVVIGYDDRFSFAMPVYGALSLTESCGSFSTIYGNGVGAAETWDGLDGLKNTNCKVFAVNSVKDLPFSMDANSRCAKAAKGFTLFKKVFPHGQEIGALEENLPFFAKYFCGMESEFVEVLQNPTVNDPTISFRTYGDVKIENIKIMYTDSVKTDRYATWDSKAVKTVEGVTTYTLNVPSSAKHYYVHIQYNNNLEVTSYLVSL